VILCGMEGPTCSPGRENPMCMCPYNNVSEEARGVGSGRRTYRKEVLRDTGCK